MSAADHDRTWEPRLQDWVDGALSESDRSLTQMHLQHCSHCRELLAELKRVDAALRGLIAPALPSSFDQHVLAQVDRLDRDRRIAARQRLERELKLELDCIRRDWHQQLTLMLPGIAAGIAFAFGLAAAVDLGAWLPTSNEPWAASTTSWLEAALVAATGAGIGALVSMRVLRR